MPHLYIFGYWESYWELPQLDNDPTYPTTPERAIATNSISPALFVRQACASMMGGWVDGMLFFCRSLNLDR